MIRDRKEKRCPRCDTTKAINQFYKAKHRPDGRNAYCKVCCRELAAERRNKPGYRENYREWWENVGKHKHYHWNPEQRAKRLEYDKWYRATKNGKESRQGIDARRRQRKDTQEKERAHRAIRTEIRAGRMPHISTQKCVECGNQADNYHHHNGYDSEHWYDVVPLCITCHNLAHLDSVA